MREPIWMETERANMNETQFRSYAAHEYDPNMLTCRPSKHVPCVYLVCKSLYKWQALHKEQRDTSSHKKGLALKPGNHTRTCKVFTNMKQQLKAQEETWMCIPC
jgi:hypothetical protein